MRLRSLALSLSLALPLATTTAPASAAPRLTVASTTLVPGLPGGMFGSVLSAEAPDGTVYVVTGIAGVRTLWASPTKGAATELVTNVGLGTPVAIAADTTRVYVGSPVGIHAYSRRTGAVAQHWALKASPRALTQLAVADNRVWALQTPLGFKPAPSTLIELDAASATPVRTLTGLAYTSSIATTSSAVYYVTGATDTLVRLTNAGARSTASPHVDLSHLIDGAAGALSADSVAGSTLVIREAFGEGDDTSLLAYDAATLSGPGKGTSASDAVQVSPTALGLLEVTNSADLACSKPQAQVCVRHFGLKGVGSYGPALVLPDVTSDRILGPHAAVVAYDVHNKTHVVRIH